MPEDLTDDKSTLVQVMAWCRQATSHYLKQCRVKVFSLILDSSVGLSAGIQSAGDWVSETLWVRILHSAEEDNLSPFDSKIACLCQSIEINNKYIYIYFTLVSYHSFSHCHLSQANITVNQKNICPLHIYHLNQVLTASAHVPVPVGVRPSTGIAMTSAIFQQIFFSHPYSEEYLADQVPFFKITRDFSKMFCHLELLSMHDTGSNT